VPPFWRTRAHARTCAMSDADLYGGGLQSKSSVAGPVKATGGRPFTAASQMTPNCCHWQRFLHHLVHGPLPLGFPALLACRFLILYCYLLVADCSWLWPESLSLVDIMALFKGLSWATPARFTANMCFFCLAPCAIRSHCVGPAQA